MTCSWPSSSGMATYLSVSLRAGMLLESCSVDILDTFGYLQKLRICTLVISQESHVSGHACRAVEQRPPGHKLTAGELDYDSAKKNTDGDDGRVDMEVQQVLQAFRCCGLSSCAFGCVVCISHAL